MLFVGLITTHKAVVENPEQTRDIHGPSNILVTERVKLIKFTCRKTGGPIFGVCET